MNRNSLVVALAASILSLTLAACGGGGGSSPQSAPVIPPSDPTGGTTGGGTSGTKGGGGTAGLPTIPGCIQRQVNIALLGDETMMDYNWSNRLQTLLNTKFGAGNTVIYSYAAGFAGTANSLYITGDVIVENYGLYDMINGLDPVVYQDHVTSYTRATLLVTQIATGSEVYNDVPYVSAVLAAGAAKGLPVADVNAWMKVQATPNSQVFDSNYNLKTDEASAIVDAVIYPEVEKQVAPLRCVAP